MKRVFLLLGVLLYLPSIAYSSNCNVNITGLGINYEKIEKRDFQVSEEVLWAVVGYRGAFWSDSEKCLLFAYNVWEGVFRGHHSNYKIDGLTSVLAIHSVSNGRVHFNLNNASRLNLFGELICDNTSWGEACYN